MKAHLVLGYFVASLALFSVPAHSEKCDTQNEMNKCAANSYEKADAELNKVYAQVLKEYEQNDIELAAEQKRLGISFDFARPSLIKAQKAWITFRDATCTLENVNGQGGSMHGMEFSGCLRRLTLKRIDELKGKTSCDGGSIE